MTVKQCVRGYNGRTVADILMGLIYDDNTVTGWVENPAPLPTSAPPPLSEGYRSYDIQILVEALVPAIFNLIIIIIIIFYNIGNIENTK